MSRAFAPGRVNLIGEHTDYNDGLCLPFAIERGITVSAARLSDGAVEELEGPYAQGVGAELRAAGHAVPPVRIEIESDLPRGAGLSSSAALEVAVALALIDLAGDDEPDRVELAKLCSRVERDWAGADTGLLDQLAVLL